MTVRCARSDPLGWLHFLYQHHARMFYTRKTLGAQNDTSLDNPQALCQRLHATRS